MKELHEKVIETRRLLLKSITQDTIISLFKARSKSEIISYLAIDEEVYLKYLELFENGNDEIKCSKYFFLLTDKESSEVLGEVGFHSWNKIHRRADLFYVIRKDEYKRKGYTSEAMEVILDFGFKELNLHRIAAFIAKDNHASLGVLTKFGFTFEGTMREDYVVNGKSENSECYSLLVHEREKTNGSINF